MSTWLVDRSSRFLAKRVSRRGFLERMALAGSALVTAPMTFTLKPVTAFQAVCSCSGQSCTCSSLCCDGYTEFCCTIYGTNTCPPGSRAAGWWKVSGSGFCGGANRYYLDCNASCNGCGCGGSGLCSKSCADCNCGCANGSCGNRKACCTSFRYGQCGNDVACLGPIICRVVTCTPPWVFDATCSTTSATDNNTRFHDRPCLHEKVAYPEFPVVYLPDEQRWHLADTLDSSPLVTSFLFGTTGETPITGDWDGDGTKTIGTVRNSRFGRYRDGVMWWRLRNDVGAGEPSDIFSYGEPGDVPIAGDWNGDGTDTVGVVSGNVWKLRNANSGGDPDVEFTFGEPGDTFVTGDWNGDGIDTPGFIRGNRLHLRNSNSAGAPDLEFDYGSGAGIYVMGDWNGDGVDTPAYVDGSVWAVRNSNSAGVADEIVVMPVVGLPLAWSPGSGSARPGLPVPSDQARIV